MTNPTVHNENQAKKKMACFFLRCLGQRAPSFRKKIAKKRYTSIGTCVLFPRIAIVCFLSLYQNSPRFHIRLLIREEGGGKKFTFLSNSEGACTHFMHTQLWSYEHLRGRGEGGGGVCSILMHGRSGMTIDPRIATMPGRIMSDSHRPGRHCLHRARSAVVCSASRVKGGLHPTKNRLWVFGAERGRGAKRFFSIFPSLNIDRCKLYWYYSSILITLKLAHSCCVPIAGWKTYNNKNSSGSVSIHYLEVMLLVLSGPWDSDPKNNKEFRSYQLSTIIKYYYVCPSPTI